MSSDFSTLETLQAAARKWWLLAGLMLIGALAGLAFSLLQPPVYEAVVSFSLGIDFTRTGVMTQYEQDLALGMAGNQIRSTGLARQVAEDARAAGIEITAKELIDSSTIERKHYIWNLRVQHTDPQAAAFLANAWAERAMDWLEEAHRHAENLESLQAYSRSLESCLAQFAAAEPASRLCNPANLDELQQELALVRAAMETEQAASRNIIPALLFEDTLLAEVPSQPRLYNRIPLMLAGAFIGLIAGLWLVYLRTPQRLIDQRQA